MKESFTSPPSLCEKCGCRCTFRIQVAGGSWQCEPCYRKGHQNSFSPGDPMLPQQGEDAGGFPWLILFFLVACGLSALGGGWWGMTR